MDDGRMRRKLLPDLKAGPMAALGWLGRRRAGSADPRIRLRRGWV